jgi:thiamine biosynthesis lipoprotein
VNILFGAVLSLWHQSREIGIADPDNAALPDAAALNEAAKHVSPDVLVIDRAAGTVQLTDPQARLDVGAIAKGYAVEQAARYAAQQLGWTSALLSIGGNVRAIGAKGGADSATPYTVGIQNPDTDSAQAYLMTVDIDNMAVVTSGDYQRYYTVDGKRYAHIIDTETLYPATYVRAVSVICPDSAMADVLSTALFTMPVEQGLALLEKTADAHAMWVLADGSLRYSAGFEAYGTV